MKNDRLMILAILGLIASLGMYSYMSEPVEQPAPIDAHLLDRAPQEFIAAVHAEKARSQKWEAVQKLHIKRESHCAWCGGTAYLQVHHIHPFAMNPELQGSDAPGGELDDGKDGTGRDGNLITLCEIPKKVAKTPDEEDHHLKYGHSGHFEGGENLNVREDCAKHEAEMRAAGTWPRP